MTYYAFIKNNQINGVGQVRCLNANILNYEISQDIFENIEKYIWDGENVVLDSEYEYKKAKKEKEILIEKIKKEIEETDLKRIRAICEPSIKDETINQSWLEYYNDEILKLREKINQLLSEN